MEDETCNVVPYDGKVGIPAKLIHEVANNSKILKAGDNLATTALVLTETLKHAVLPFAVVNFAISSFKKYYEEKFSEDLEEKLADIPDENRVSPKAYISGPILRNLAFSHEEETLRDMYVSLLASSMDNRESRAHPGYVEIIKQLTPEEGNLLKPFLNSDSSLPIVEINFLRGDGKGFFRFKRHLMNFIDVKTDEPRLVVNHENMIDNWIRLGLVEINYSIKKADPTAYDWVDARPEMEFIHRESEEKKYELKILKGVIERTAYGIGFGRAVGIIG